MDTSFWQRIHGGSTHFPIVLPWASVMFDFVAWRSRDKPLQRGLHAAGLGSVVGGIGAAIAGLIITRGRLVGMGGERLHHLFVWPGFALCIAFVGLRLFRTGRIPQRGASAYVAGMSVAAALMVGAGYSGGEMLSGSNKEKTLFSSDKLTCLPDPPASGVTGQQLFLKNCAHCHGADGRGDDGPDLHSLGWTDEQLATRIRNGKKGQMTAFSGKLTREQIRDLVAYVGALK
jgi:mono/diheme cytochrome c family protein